MLSETFVQGIMRRAAGKIPFRPYADLLAKGLLRFPQRRADLESAKALQAYLTAKSREAREYELELVIKGTTPEQAAEMSREQLLSDLSLMEQSEQPSEPLT